MAESLDNFQRDLQVMLARWQQICPDEVPPDIREMGTQKLMDLNEYINQVQKRLWVQKRHKGLQRDALASSEDGPRQAARRAKGRPVCQFLCQGVDEASVQSVVAKILGQLLLPDSRHCMIAGTRSLTTHVLAALYFALQTYRIGTREGNNIRQYHTWVMNIIHALPGHQNYNPAYTSICDQVMKPSNAQYSALPRHILEVDDSRLRGNTELQRLLTIYQSVSQLLEQNGIKLPSSKNTK